MIVETLEYMDSKGFLGPSEFDQLPPSELSFGLQLAVDECPKLGGDDRSALFRGAYTLRADSARPVVPVVFVVEVSTDAAARRIHQFIWNQNQSPFLIVESPSHIRLYPGFSYSREEDQPLVTTLRDAAKILERLSAFRAASIDDGRVWREWGSAVDPKARVDKTLLRDLKSLDARLQGQEHVDRKVSHGLIGKYIYLRYLRDRDILSKKKLAKWGIDPDDVFTQRATLKAFAAVDAQLQDWLNGSVFSLGDFAPSDITQSQLRLIASVLRGGSPVADGSIQPSLFDVYDFAHISIETLSCVYEQFLHDAKEPDGETRGKKLGAFYTPPPLADHVVSELDRTRLLQPGMQTLDFACGSGAFLVQCYRRLVERQQRLERRKLKATELRDLLTENIFGIDQDADACRVAELSLILALLEYVDPPDLENTTFKLPRLRGVNIIEGDFFQPKGPVHSFLADRKFDWIVGNPPWAETAQSVPPEHHHFHALNWMTEHKQEYPTSGNQLAEGFMWKAVLHLKPGGLAGIVMPAMTWFKNEGATFRQQFFRRHRVWCLGNFANLAYVLFGGRSRRPASMVCFKLEPPKETDVVVTYAPFVTDLIANRPNRPGRQLAIWNIVISDVREIENSRAAAGDSLTWKLAMWGTSRDKKLLDRLGTRFASITSLGELGIDVPREGFGLRRESQETKRYPLLRLEDLIDKKKIDFKKLRKIGRIFVLPDDSLGTIGPDECYIRKRGGQVGIAGSRPPHVIVDAARRFAIFSDEFIAVPPRQIGIPGTSKESLRALSLFLSSDFCTYHQFFNSPQWGIDEQRADLEALKCLPIPLSRLEPKQLEEWGQVQLALAAESDRQLKSEKPGRTTERFSSLLADLNDRVYRLLGLRESERWLIEDFVQLHLQLTFGKTTADVVRPPEHSEMQRYLAALRDNLDGFLSADRGLRHRLRVLVDRDSAFLAVSLTPSSSVISPDITAADDTASNDLQKIRHGLLTAHSQWVYFDRQLKIYDRRQGTLYQFKPLELLHWTRRRAVLDADDIRAETLIEGGTK